MRHNKGHRPFSWWGNRQIFWLLALLIAVAAIGMRVSQLLLLDNARTLGKNLVTSYSLDENRNLSDYESIIAMGMTYLNELSEKGISTEELGDWAADFFERSAQLLGVSGADVCAVIDGMLVQSDGTWHREYRFQDSVWYQQAMRSPGEVIFTDAHVSEIHGQMVVTIAAANAQTGNAIAFDLPMEHFRNHHSVQDLPEGGAYYVCDSMGNLLYYSIPFEAGEEELDRYVKDLFDRVSRGELDGKNNSIIGMQGLQRGLYYQHSRNGWLCILTVPYDTLLQGVQGVLVWYGAGIGLFIAVAVGMWLRDRRLSRTAQRSAETVQVLGNMYYALYRINVNSGTYEMTKGSDFIKQELPDDRGDYSDLLRAIISSLDEWTGEEFANNFSLDKIKQLIDQQVKDFGGEFLRKFGEDQHWISVRVLTDPVQIPNEAVLCFRDVEAEKEEQQKQVRLLKGALSAAEQSEKSQKQFFSIMSHDMRTPLNIIIGMVSLALQPDCGREKMTACLHKINTAGQQLLALINDILEISRLEQGNVSMEIKPFDLRQTLETCISPFQTQAREQGKQLRLSIEVENWMVKGDPARLDQIINNLVSNAMKFTGRGDSISVSLRQMDKGKRNNYLFTVEDTGAGMSKDYLPKLFDPYEREVRFGAKEVMGTGLGMPIVKNLVTRMGGQITVNSVLGEGSSFAVTLPFDVGELPQSPLPPPAPAKTSPSLDQLEGRQILLAEDNLLNMEIATELLKMRGAEVTPAENGREAVKAFLAREPYFFDAVLMDMQMPELDGCQAAEAIRAASRPDAKTLPIIALTANAFAEDISRTAQAGMNAHLSKPINIELLCTTLIKLMSGRNDARKTPTDEE